MSKKLIISGPSQNDKTYRLYDDYTYDCVHWGKEDYRNWSIKNNIVCVEDHKAHDDKLIVLAEEAHDIMLFNKEVEEFLSEDKETD